MKKSQAAEAFKKEQEEQMKKLAEKQENIVIYAREKLLPILEEKNPSINDAKLICDTLAVAIMQGQFQLLKDHKVEDLKLLELIKEDYPQYDTVIEIVKSINDLSMEYGVEVCQWFTEKIKKMVEDENKDRAFKDLKVVI
jgi:hypothetical protein